MERKSHMPFAGFFIQLETHGCMTQNIERDSILVGFICFMGISAEISQANTRHFLIQISGAIYG